MPAELGPRRAGRPAGSNRSADILAAAKRLFLRDGYDGVSLEQVGDAAGVTRQTVYNLFGSKDALFGAMAERHWAVITEDAGAALSAADAAEGDPARILHRFGAAIVRFVESTEQVAFTRLVIAESRARPALAEEFYRLGKQPLLAGFVACLRRLDAAGSIRCADPVIAAHQFFGMIQEVVIWPHVMAIGPPAAELPPAERAVAEAVATFLGRYGCGATA